MRARASWCLGPAVALGMLMGAYGAVNPRRDAPAREIEAVRHLESVARTTRRAALDPQSVSFVSPSSGWAWGPGPRWLSHGVGPGVLEHTDDGGHTWRVVATADAGYTQQGGAAGESGVRFVDRRHGFLFGARLYATADGGTRWTLDRPPGTILDLEGDPGRVYALVCQAATCARAHLDRVSGDGSRFTSVAAVGSPNVRWSNLVVYGPSAYLLVPPQSRGLGSESVLWADPSGLGWRRLTAPCTWAGALGGELAAWSARGLALACGSQPGTEDQAKTFYVSFNGGRRWRRTGHVPFILGGILSLAAAGPHTWALAEDQLPTLEMTRDGGRRWYAAPIKTAGGAVDGWGSVSFTDPRHAVAVPELNGSLLAFTADAGRRWSVTTFPSARSAASAPK